MITKETIEEIYEALIERFHARGSENDDGEERFKSYGFEDGAIAAIIAHVEAHFKEVGLSMFFDMLEKDIMAALGLVSELTAIAVLEEHGGRAAWRYGELAATEASDEDIRKAVDDLLGGL